MSRLSLSQNQSNKCCSTLLPAPFIHLFFSWWRREKAMATKPFSYLLFLFLCLSLLTKSGANRVAALYVFGDSDLDNGNNNNKNTLAKANYPPYGIDYPKGVTGRFTNGQTIADYLGKFKVEKVLTIDAKVKTFKLTTWNAANLLHLNQPLAFLGPKTDTEIRPEGYDYASASAGILPETGRVVVVEHQFS